MSQARAPSLWGHNGFRRLGGAQGGLIIYFRSNFKKFNMSYLSSVRKNLVCGNKMTNMKY